MDEILRLHKNGKIKIVSNTPIDSIAVLRQVYTPGVADVCKMIVNNPALKNIYTGISYTVAIVTDGTRILGLGNIGSVAGMPVMEGKAALLQELVGVNGIPILMGTKDAEEIIRTVKNIAPTFGGIQLEDIESPKCFTIFDRLEKELNIPVMHDDQQGTSVVILAGLINACKLAKISLQEAKIGLIGLGAAGLAVGKLLYRYTGKPALGTARSEASIQRHVTASGIASNFDEIMKTADIVIATSGVSDLIKPEMVHKGQIIFALTNPYPEIEPEMALKAGAFIAVDGKEINNVLGFPGLWRGTFDAQASKFTYEMYRAAALALAKAAPEGKLVPDVFAPGVFLKVTHAVAKAAMDSGVAQRKLGKEYFDCQDVKKIPGE